MSNVAKIQLCAFISSVVIVILFIIIAFSFEMINTKVSGVFNVDMKDGTAIQIIILTDKPYNDKHWRRIKKTVKIEANKLDTIMDITNKICDTLETNGTSVTKVTGSKNVYEVYP